MKRFKIYWTEKHSKYVEAENDEKAVEDALGDMADSCDYQTIDEVDLVEDKIGPDEMDAAKEADDEKV